MSDNLYSSSYRNDENLNAILDEVSEWAVHARRGRILCFASSLRDALEKYGTHTSAGVSVEVLTRLPSDDIVVHSAQIVRMKSHIVSLEIVANQKRKHLTKTLRTPPGIPRPHHLRDRPEQAIAVAQPNAVAPTDDAVESTV
jgi:hypothetical protein